MNAALIFKIGIDAEGIDAVAGTVLHEKKHQWIHHNWPTPPLPDLDEDGVPDAEEGKPPYYLSKTDPDSYNLASIDEVYADWGDQEFLCRMEEKNYISDASKDWAYPGKQWASGKTQY